jgi:hypothetical protein
MDTNSILQGIAERDRWIRRVQTLEQDLLRIRRRITVMEKRRRKLDKELTRLTALSSAMTEGRLREDNERAPPLPTLR